MEHDLAEGYAPPRDSSNAEAVPEFNRQEFLNPSNADDELDVAVYTEHQVGTVQDPSFASDEQTSVVNNIALEFTDSHVAPYAPVDGKIGSSSVPSVVMGDDGQDGRSLLTEGAELSSSGPPHSLFGNISDGSGGEQTRSSKAWFWNPVRYQGYFDVDTNDVRKRMVDSLKGPFMPHFLNETRSNPDLYGPFWIATTVIFITAMTGNLDGYMSHSKNTVQSGSHDGNNATNHKSSTSPSEDWFYDIDKVIYSAMLFYGYVGIIGLLLWSVLMYFKSNLSLVNIWCLYGYSLTIFLPIAPLCTIPLGWLQWIMVLLAATMSGLFLMLNLTEEVKNATRASAFPILAVVFGLHLSLGLSLKLFFFQF